MSSIRGANLNSCSFFLVLILAIGISINDPSNMKNRMAISEKEGNVPMDRFPL